MNNLLLPEWHGWHAARRGLGSNLYRLGVPDMVIQRILRHANVSTTATYYIKTAANDVRDALAKLENSIPSVTEAPKTSQDTFGTLNLESRAVTYLGKLTWDNGVTSQGPRSSAG